MTGEPLGAVDLKLYFLGRRDYVNGLTMFEEMVKAFESYPSSRVVRPILIRQFRFNRFVRSHARMEILAMPPGQPAERPVLKGENARVDLMAPGADFTLLLLEKPEEPVATSLPEYDRGVYIAEQENRPDGTVSAEMANVHDAFELLRGIVEVMQRITDQELQALTGRPKSYWGYIKGYPFLLDERAAGVHSVLFEKSSIIRGRDRMFAVRQVRLEGPEGNAPAEICYFS